MWILRNARLSVNNTTWNVNQNCASAYLNNEQRCSGPRDRCVYIAGAV